jgi:hypothetical protein
MRAAAAPYTAHEQCIGDIDRQTGGSGKIGHEKVRFG